VSDIQENDELSRTDPIAQGSEIAMRVADAGVRRVQAAVAPERIPDGNGGSVPQVADADGKYPQPDCIECEDPIPSVRLEMGRIRCVICQTLKEKRR